MVFVILLLALMVIFLTLVAAVEFENNFSEDDQDWDNESWETQRG
jgi:hypothetical protein